MATLEAGGIDIAKISGYTFKEGSRGGKGKPAEKSGIQCEECGTAVTKRVAAYAKGKFGKRLCMACQKKAAAAEEEDKPAPGNGAHPPEDPPPIKKRAAGGKR